MSVSADTVGERQFLPEAHSQANYLLLAIDIMAPCRWRGPNWAIL